MRPKPRLPDLTRRSRVLVLGLGVHGGGVATVRYLRRLGCPVRVTDRKPARELSTSLAALRGVRFERRFGAHRIADIRWADLVVQNPAVPRDSPLIRAARRWGKPVVNDAVLFLSAAPGPVVAVTGTRGKSTTVALAAAMLNCARAGLPAEPLLGALANLRPGRPVVAEFSSWQCELVAENRTAPDVAVFTNLSPDHLNRYPSFAAYASAKAGLLRYQTPHDSAAVINHDHPVLRRLGRAVAGRRWWFSKARFAEENGAFLAGGHLAVRAEGRVYRVASRRFLRLAGAHLTEDALAAMAAAWLLSPNPARIRAALRAFRGLPGRQERVAEKRGVAFVNDTAATSPAGTLAALSTFPPSRTVLIVGGEDKGMDFSALARALPGCRTVVALPGSATDRLLHLAGDRVAVLRAAGMAEAVGLAARAARRGDIVLLSPAAASFNLFRHEYDRGAQFIAAVEALP